MRISCGVCHNLCKDHETQLCIASIAAVCAISLLIPGILALSGQIPMHPYQPFAISPGMSLPLAVSLTTAGGAAAILAISLVACAAMKHGAKGTGNVA